MNMNSKDKQSKPVDGFITRRPNRNMTEQYDRTVGFSDTKSNRKLFPRKSSAHGIAKSAKKPKKEELTGTLVFDDEAPLEIKRPESQPNGKWSKFAKRREKNIDGKRGLRKRILVGCSLVILVAGGWFGFKLISNLTSMFNGSNLLTVFDNTKLKGEDVGRVNILLAGNSADDKGHDGAELTDSIMLISIDTIHNNAVMVSIPRDLWVDYQTQDCVVGYQGKINATYLCGEQTKFNQPGYPKGGMGALEKVVHDNLGVNINYYALVNYAAFKQSVDSVGGIKINIQTDDPRGIYDPTFDWQCNNTCKYINYKNGPVSLDGEQALRLARARGDFGGYGAGNDFGRAERQRQMMVALKDKTLSAGTLANPVKMTKLMDSIGKNVHTDMKPNEVKRLYTLGKLIDSNNIQSVGLTMENYLTSYDGMGQSALAPRAGVDNFTEIKAYLKRILSSDPVAQEDSHIVVLNGSGLEGAASTQAEKLANIFTIDEVGNADKTYTTTKIYALGKGRENSRKRLKSLYHTEILSKKALPPSLASYNTDFILIVGSKDVPK